MANESFDPLDPDIDVAGPVNDFVRWFVDTFDVILSAVKTGLGGLYDGLLAVLNAPPFWVLVLLFAGIALVVRSWPFAIFSLGGFYLIAAMDQWDAAMQTLSLVLIASTVASLLAIPLGIWAAKSQAVSNTIRPVLDFMQTLPAMLYLIPALFAFSIGPVTGMFATVVFAMPPGVRFTELAIRQVDAEVVEAGHAFGSTPGRILRQIQLPLALPTIMAGINQVIMLALSMVVLAALVGASGLGATVLSGLSSLNVGRGFEAGLAVVILAIYLDRIVAALAERAPVVRASRARN
jgi:glycine betaine/proline transport system permease protein